MIFFTPNIDLSRTRIPSEIVSIMHQQIINSGFGLFAYFRKWPNQKKSTKRFQTFCGRSDTIQTIFSIFESELFLFSHFESNQYGTLIFETRKHILF